MFQWETIFKGNKNVVFLYRWSLKQIRLYLLTLVQCQGKMCYMIWSMMPHSQMTWVNCLNKHCVLHISVSQNTKIRDDAYGPLLHWITIFFHSLLLFSCSENGYIQQWQFFSKATIFVKGDQGFKWCIHLPVGTVQVSCYLQPSPSLPGILWSRPGSDHQLLWRIPTYE